MTATIKLNPARLLGFRLVANPSLKMGIKEDASATQSVHQGSMPNAKLGDKRMVLGARLGNKPT